MDIHFDHCLFCSAIDWLGFCNSAIPQNISRKFECRGFGVLAFCVEDMILITHEVIGGALAVATKASPAGAFFLGLISHYLFDMVPHWHYRLVREGEPFREWTERGGSFIKKFIREARTGGIIKAMLDLLGGAAVMFIIFRPESWNTALPLAFGIFGGIFPDLLSPISRIFPNRLIDFHQHVHFNIIHTKIRLDDKPIVGIGSPNFIFVNTLLVFFFFL